METSNFHSSRSKRATGASGPFALLLALLIGLSAIANVAVAQECSTKDEWLEGRTE